MTKVGIVYWKDKVGGNTEKVDAEAFPYGFTLGAKGEWQMFIAAEDIDVEPNKIVSIKIFEVAIPAESVVIPCYFMRHALGYVPALTSVGVPYKVEEKRVLKEVLFYPIAKGRINTRDLLGVANLFSTPPERRLAGDSVERWMTSRHRY